MVGPLHEGMYVGHCLAGDDLHEAVMTLAQAREWAKANPLCQGFTFQPPSRAPEPKRRRRRLQCLRSRLLLRHLRL